MDVTGWVVLAAVIAAASAFGLWRRRVDGRFASIKAAPATEDKLSLTAGEIGHPLGSRATLVQFSSAFCAPCRATRTVLDRVAQMVEGVDYVEIDAETHLDLTRKIHILRTPTVLILDPGGLIKHRAAGQPRFADVVAALGQVLPSTPPNVDPHIDRTNSSS